MGNRGVCGRKGGGGPIPEAGKDIADILTCEKHAHGSVVFHGGPRLPCDDALSSRPESVKDYRRWRSGGATLTEDFLYA